MVCVTDSSTLRRDPCFVALLDAADDVRTTAVILFGSTARDEAGPTSDLDILVVVDGADARRRLRTFVSTLQTEAMVLTEEQLLHEADVRPSFVAHLLDEGVALSSGRRWSALRCVLRARAEDERALAEELEDRVDALSPFLDTCSFSQSPVTALSHMYAIGRSLVILRLLQYGVREYSWRRAFDRLAEIRPDLGASVRDIERLRPYYDFSRSRSAIRPGRTVTTADIAEAVASIQRIAA